MTRFLYMSLTAVVLASLFHPATAAESKELRKQRQAAQKERQLKKNERNKEINESIREFREYVRGLTMDVREQVKELDTEFALRRVELKADHEARVAGAEAEYQKKLSNLFTRPGVEYDEQAIEELQVEGRAFGDEMFALKKRSAEELFAAQIANEQDKNGLWSERDADAMQEAEALGLTSKYSPILATPLGDGLTKQEERWNEREKKEVVKLEERNRKLLSEFRNGDPLRSWQIQNLKDDFKLTWDEKAELQALDSEQLFYNALFFQAAQGGQVDQQKFMEEMAENNQKRKLIQINYKKVRDKENIRRRVEKKEISQK